MLTFDTPPFAIRLTGDWKVRPLPSGSGMLPNTSLFEEKLLVPEVANLQPVLYPDRPYWGDHLRALNEQDWVYRKVFTPPDVPFSRARLRFEGVDYYADVWLNGSRIGQHEGSFEPFTLDVTEELRRGEANTLAVRVSAPWDEPNPRGSYPINHVLRGLVKGHYEHGEGVIPPNVNPIGIWRPVYLLLDQGVSLDRVQIQPGLDGMVHMVFFATNVTGKAWSGRLVMEVVAENHDGPGVRGEVEITIPPGQAELTQRIQIPEPRLWWPWDHGAPNLYRLTATLHTGDRSGTESTLVQTFGLRTIRLERSAERFTWFINERPVFLRGSSYMPGLYLGHVTPENMEQDIQLAREANLNLLRVHVHVSPPEVYDLCDRAGILIWQDFELNWVQDPSLEFEQRALKLQEGMVKMLYNHPAILTWTCHNEPTMVFVHRENYEEHPDPALYAAIQRLDTTRPSFICSGQMEDDWQRAGDIHTYYGAIMSKDYTQVYRHNMRMNTEFGFEAPAALETLQMYPDAWSRLNHLEGKIDALWDYQAELVQFHVEHLRRTRVTGSAGYVHFWLADLVPQVGCGVLDARRIPKGGYAALKLASQPLHVALEHDGRRFYALWVFNDTMQAYPGATARWQVQDAGGKVIEAGETPVDVRPNESQRIMDVRWSLRRSDVETVVLALIDRDGEPLCENTYTRPLQPSPRPRGYPWKFDPYLGFKVFDRPDAVSLADQASSGVMKMIPLPVREAVAEWGMRQKLPLWLLSFIARVTKPFVQP